MEEAESMSWIINNANCNYVNQITRAIQPDNHYIYHISSSRRSPYLVISDQLLTSVVQP